ncbi:hypothetical protein ES702_02089 [subsurface metagenome]
MNKLSRSSATISWNLIDVVAVFVIAFLPFVLLAILTQTKDHYPLTYLWNILRLIAPIVLVIGVRKGKVGDLGLIPGDKPERCIWIGVATSIILLTFHFFTIGAPLLEPISKCHVSLKGILASIFSVFGKHGFLIVILIPLSEELFYRGFLYPAFKKRWGIVWGVIISSAIFSLAHFDSFTLGVLLDRFLKGVVFACLYERYKTLIPSLAAHSTNNFIGNSIAMLLYFNKAS